jgi:hypothetical protein
MKNILHMLFILVFFPAFLEAQTCVGSFTLNNQSEVDNFGPCDTITGSLVIKNTTDITNLDGLAGLKHVGQILDIRSNVMLENLDGLSSLQSVGTIFFLSNNFSLQNIDGLSSLQSIGLGFFLVNNDQLKDVNGLSNLTTVGGRLQLGGNLNLISLEGLSSLQAVGENLIVADNANLGNCGGISQLVDPVDDGASGPGPGAGGVPDVGGTVTISSNLTGCLSKEDILLGYTVVTTQSEVDNMALLNMDTVKGNLIIGPSSSITNLNALEDLESVEGNFLISGNDNLESFGAGLRKLKSVGCNFEICGNDALCNLESLGAATLLFVSADLIVTNNPNLSDCCGLLPLFTVGEVVGSIIMANNFVPGNCNNNGVDVTEANCPTIAVPSLTEWGLFLFGLIILTLGVVMLYNHSHSRRGMV